MLYHCLSTSHKNTHTHTYTYINKRSIADNENQKPKSMNEKKNHILQKKKNTLNYVVCHFMQILHCICEFQAFYCSTLHYVDLTQNEERESEKKTVE